MIRGEPSHLIAIGSSAGGPSALATLLGGLPETFPGAIVIVQHVDPRMVPGMAEWLNDQTPLPVRVAAEGEPPQRGAILVAGSSEHLVLKSTSRLGYTPEPRHGIYSPAVDVLFDSIAARWRGRAIGVLLTGMGRDGAVGLKALRDAGHHTIAQDEKSSAVYGMPKAAAALRAAVEILPMDRIAARLVRLTAA